MNNEKPRFKGAVKAGSETKTSSLGSPFKNPFSKFILPAVSNERAPTSLNGYVPTGLSEAEYKAAKSAVEAKKAQNKQRFPKGKKTLDIADWLKQMESKQTFKGDQFASSGHTYAKTKFSFDGSNKMNNEKPRFKGAVKAGSDTKDTLKSSLGSPFKNPFSKFILPAVRNERAPTSLNGYVPNGLSEAEYKAAKSASEAKKVQNKQRFPKKSRTLDIADWLKQMESKQTFKGDQFASFGHTYAKTKFSFDGSNKMNNEKPRFKGAVKAGSDTKDTLKSSL